MRAERIAPGLAERLRKVIEEDAGGNSAAWAGAMGVSKSLVSDWLNKGVSITAINLFRIAQRSDLSLNWLLTGQGPARLKEILAAWAAAERETPYACFERDYVLVPQVAVMAGDGSGVTIRSEQIVNHLAFKADWVRGNMGLDAARLVLVTIRGDSMEPTLKAGDLLLLDMRVTQVHNDAIYVLRRDADLVAKRLQRGFDGSVLIRSDNSAYETQVVPPERAGQLEIIGRVVWNGRRM